MKTLILVRHAKSSWKDMNLSDHERPLNKRGNRDAPVMGKRLAQHGVPVDIILSSTAVRARTTAKIIAEQIDYKSKIVQEEELYLADEEDLLDAIFALENSHHVVMLVAHNPGMTWLVNELSGQSIDNVPTCGIAILEYDCQKWTDIAKKRPVSFIFDYPKNVI